MQECLAEKPPKVDFFNDPILSSYRVCYIKLGSETVTILNLHQVLSGWSWFSSEISGVLVPSHLQECHFESLWPKPGMATCHEGANFLPRVET